jgi:hypothetical protein
MSIWGRIDGAAKCLERRCAKGVGGYVCFYNGFHVAFDVEHVCMDKLRRPSRTHILMSFLHKDVIRDC